MTVEWKRDALGYVDLVEVDGLRVVRRVVTRRPGWAQAARLLARREARALAHLAAFPALAGRVPASLARGLAERAAAVPDVRGAVPRETDVFVRGFLAGVPLHRAEWLPYTFFAELTELVEALHAAGVCHNDLHKEQNVLVLPSGAPALIDLQLASVHPGFDRSFRVRCHEDLRHVQKHQRRYTRDGRGPAELAVPSAARLPRRPLARAWRRLGKPLYELLTRRVLGTRDGEERRPSSGPWPRFGGPGEAPPGAPESTTASPLPPHAAG